MKPAIGDVIGGYTLLELLGAGGSASVYLGEHVYLKTPAAIKVLRYGAGFEKEELEQFKKEARIIALLQHRHIVRILGFGVEHGLAYLIMEYAANGSFRSKHPKGSVLLVPTIISYVKQVADALHHAHQQRIVHCDVKPENFLLGPNGEILLSDFGIAQTIQTKSHQQDVGGTLRYMAPEQFNGKALPASDQYSLGIVVYEWLCGQVPFNGRNMAEMYNLHMHGTAPSLREKKADITEELEFVVFKAIAKTPSERYESVQTFAAALEAAMEPTLPGSEFAEGVPAQVINPSPLEDNVSVLSFLPRISSLIGEKDRLVENPLNNPVTPPSSSEAIELLPPASTFLPHQD